MSLGALGVSIFRFADFNQEEGPSNGSPRECVDGVRQAMRSGAAILRGAERRVATRSMTLWQSNGYGASADGSGAGSNRQ